MLSQVPEAEEVKKMTKVQERALVVLTAALIGGAVLQIMVKQQAAVLGLSKSDIAFLGLVAGGLGSRLQQNF